MCTPQQRESSAMKNPIGTIATLIAAATLTGCGSPPPTVTTDKDTEVITLTPNGPPPAMDAHDHGKHGPHGGLLIEIGKASFHGELLHDENQVTIYMLDANAKASTAIDAPKVTVSIKHDGEVQSYDLAAKPEPTETNGKSSRFTSEDNPLAMSLTDGAEGVVIFQLGGKSYNGSISHKHDHADHSGHSH